MIVFAIITDLYTIRRVLDKKYISDSLVYTGYFHTINLANILII